MPVRQCSDIFDSSFVIALRCLFLNAHLTVPCAERIDGKIEALWAFSSKAAVLINRTRLVDENRWVQVKFFDPSDAFGPRKERKGTWNDTKKKNMEKSGTTVYTHALRKPWKVASPDGTAADHVRCNISRTWEQVRPVLGWNSAVCARVNPHRFSNFYSVWKMLYFSEFVRLID